MEMSVKAGGHATNVQQPKRVPGVHRSNASELDAWLEKAEAMGELKRITAEVSPDLEAAHITYLVGLEKSPVLLFENIKGHPGHKALYNMIGCNLSRFCLMIGEEPVDHPLKAVQLLQLGANGPDVFGPERRLRSDQLALISGCALDHGRGGILPMLHGHTPSVAEGDHSAPSDYPPKRLKLRQLLELSGRKIGCGYEDFRLKMTPSGHSGYSAAIGPGAFTWDAILTMSM
jgi:hypothetical protein